MFSERDNYQWNIVFSVSIGNHNKIRFQQYTIAFNGSSMKNSAKVFLFSTLMRDATFCPFQLTKHAASQFELHFL